MRTLWLSAIAVWLVAAGTVVAYDRIVVDAALVDSSRTISGVVRVKFDAIEDRLTDLRFRLYPNKPCRGRDCGIEIDSLLVDGRDVSSAMVIDGTDMLVPLPDSTAGIREPAVAVWFRAIIPEGVDRFGYYDDQYVLETWFPMPAPRGDGRWLRTDYTGEAEPVADFYDFEVHLSFPSTYVPIAPGIRAVDSSGAAHAVHVVLPSAHECSIVLGRNYVYRESRVGEASVKVFYRARDAFAVDTLQETIRQTMEFMASEVLEYPYEEFVAVLGGFRGGGLETPRMILLPRPPIRTGTRFGHALVIHEVVHQWFYGLLNSNQADHPWLDESVTEYFTIRINKTLAGGRPSLLDMGGFSADYILTERFSNDRYVRSVPINRPSSSYTRPDYYGTIYNKGSLVIKTLTGLMGAENEREFWQEYASRYSHTRVGPTDFYELADDYLPAMEGADARSIIGMTVPLDFEMMGFRSDRVTESDSAVADSAEVQERKYRNVITYAALHPIGTPVLLRLDFRDETTMDTVVNPLAGQNELTIMHASSVSGAVIDPEYVYAVDVNWLNNSLKPGAGKAGSVRLFSGATFLVELLFGALWGW